MGPDGEPVRVDGHAFVVRAGPHDEVSPGEAASTAAWIDSPG